MRSEACLAFVARCESGTDVPALVAEFLRLIRTFGFNACAGGSWAGVGKARQYRFYFNGWPEDWLRFYNEQGFFHRDFIVAESRRRMRPFLWNEVDPRLFASKTAREFFDATRLWGWHDGFVVPIRGPNGHEGVVSLAASKRIELTAVERAVLEARHGLSTRNAGSPSAIASHLRPCRNYRRASLSASSGRPSGRRTGRSANSSESPRPRRISTLSR